jgi:capsule polysaccharide export protein KpsE/RkpR
MSAGTDNQISGQIAEVAERVVHEERTERARERQVQTLRMLWNRRRIVFRAGAAGLLVTVLVAFLIPKSFTSTAQLMPPDSQSHSTSGMAMMMLAAMTSKAGGAGLGSVAGDLLGMKSSGALFIGVLRSETVQDRIINQFNLKKVYHARLEMDARKALDANTFTSENKKSGIISISVADHSAQRAAAIANAYVDELNILVAQLSTSAAHRERVFLEDRLKVAKTELDDAANQLAQFSSKNSTLDMQTEGKAMLDAAGMLAGQLIATQSELEGLRQIYTDNNSRVKALKARVAELRKQLDTFDGLKGKAEEEADPPQTQSADPPSTMSTSLPFPTIRKLPLLGAKYSDYYRRAKIQETVFELLTEQYELAKVEEAKETPSVKVLDPARIPEKESFPPRLWIIGLGTILAVASSVIWVLGAKGWEETDPGDPRKALAQEVVATLKAHAPWVSHNGDGGGRNGLSIWRQFSGQSRTKDEHADQ